MPVGLSELGDLCPLLATRTLAIRLTPTGLLSLTYLPLAGFLVLPPHLTALAATTVPIIQIPEDSTMGLILYSLSTYLLQHTENKEAYSHQVIHKLEDVY